MLDGHNQFKQQSWLLIVLIIWSNSEIDRGECNISSKFYKVGTVLVLTNFNENINSGVNPD